MSFFSKWFWFDYLLNDALILQHVHEDQLSLVDDVFYDEPAGLSSEKPLEKIREETSAEIAEAIPVVG